MAVGGWRLGWLWAVGGLRFAVGGGGQKAEMEDRRRTRG